MSESVKCELYHDNFQNFKRYDVPKAQLVIADIPYNCGNDFYASRPEWYIGRDTQGDESDIAHKAAFNTDFSFNIAEFMHFCTRMLKKEPDRGEKDVLCIPADSGSYPTGRKVRIQEVHTACFLQKLQSAGFKGKSADCRCSGICTCAVS